MKFEKVEKTRKKKKQYRHITFNNLYKHLEHTVSKQLGFEWRHHQNCISQTWSQPAKLNSG